jgi:hypothetical protein
LMPALMYRFRPAFVFPESRPRLLSMQEAGHGERVSL